MKKTITSIIVGIACITGGTSVQAEDLLDIYQLAQTNDPVVLRSQAQFMAAKEDIELARSVLLPQIYASASMSASESDTISDGDAPFPSVGSIYTSESDNTSYGATLSMQIYHHDSWLRLDNAKKSAHQSDISYQVTKQDLIVRVTSAYFDVLSAQDDLIFAVAEKAAIERQLEQTKQRFSVGLTAITDVHEAQAQYDNAVAEEIRSQNDVYRAEEALRVITNVYPRNLNVLNTDRFSTTKPTPNSADAWQQTAEAKSLELIGEKIGVDIAKENINIATSGHYPTIDLSGSFSNSDDEFDTDFTKSYDRPDLDSQSIGISVTLPLYTGGATSSSVRQAQSLYVAASQNLSQTYRDVVRNTRNAYNTVIAAISGIRALEQGVISAESALKATEAGFEVGTRTIVDVLDSTRNLYNAKRNLSSTRYAYILAIIELKRASGIVTDKDLADINKGLTPPA